MPWEARNDYVDVLLDRSEPNVCEFLRSHATRALSKPEASAALKLLELERHAMLMYTSCGWFFDDISGIETVQVIAYAGRVLQLASYLFGKRAAMLEKKFVDRLATAKSNLPEQQDDDNIDNH